MVGSLGWCCWAKPESRCPDRHRQRGRARRRSTISHTNSSIISMRSVGAS
ncbi:MAG: hypothetical protein E6H53_13645 [Betaproteobacteria bacterium]|nr:MAG: hypothetical protein E6H53_13645 [Betaproteobacteria bacterium]